VRGRKPAHAGADANVSTALPAGRGATQRSSRTLPPVCLIASSRPPRRSRGHAVRSCNSARGPASCARRRPAATATALTTQHDAPGKPPRTRRLDRRIAAYHPRRRSVQRRRQALGARRIRSSDASRPTPRSGTIPVGDRRRS
jgi:hypothetical protein